MFTLKKDKGFTLIELMIVILLIGVLLSIAVPAYTEYVLRARRADCRDHITFIAMALEKFYGDRSTYTDDITGPNGLNLSPVSNRNFCTITVNALAGSDLTRGYQISGTPTNPADACGVLIYDSLGRKNRTGGAPIKECW